MRAVPAAAVLVREQHGLPAGGEPGLAAGVGEQQQREQPGHLGLAGQQRGQQPGQPDCLVAEIAPDQRAPRVARCPSVNTRYTTRSTAPRRSGRSADAGTRNAIPAWRIFRLARTSRWAIVGSGTRNAAAISAVVSPHTGAGSVPPRRQAQCRMAAGEDQGELVVGVCRIGT